MPKTILVVGLTCIDIINYMDKYPIEDSDNRVTKQVTFVYKILNTPDNLLYDPI